ncbi:MAG: transglycosylase domain-containing protein, partial [Acidimicrobiia bacterium]
MKQNLHLIERDERRGRRLPALALLTVIALLASALTGLFGFLEMNAAYGTAKDLEATYICEPDQFDLTVPDLSRLSTVYTSDGVLIGQLTERNSQPVAIENVPDVVRDAVLAAEDSDFFEHEGLDFKGILRAALENFRSDAGLQGGSTITQQVVKMNFLSTEVTLERKICEGVIAAELERRYTKDQILEFYMNSVFYGANAYGIRAASREYFNKPLTQLSIAEAATIVVPIRNPSFYSIRSEPERVERARNDVIENMAENGFITEAEAAEAIATPLEPAPHRDLVAENPEILIAAREQLLNDRRFNLGETYAERKQAIYGCPANDTECTGGGGLRITITVNKQWNDEATRILRTWFQDRSGPTGAIAMLDNRTGALRVMASGVEFGTDIEAGQRPYDIVTKGRRQAGSAFKPITLVAALENGAVEGWDITLGTYWDSSSPQEIDCGYPCSDRGNIWTVNNAEGGGGGVVSLESATYNSTNTVYAQVSVAVGPEQSVEMAHRLGIESPLNPVPSIALGAEAVSPFEMAAAYSTIANYGEKVEPYLIERIERGGEVLYDHRVQSEQVIDASLAAAVVSTLEKVVCCGTATRADIDRPQAGKTGTAQNYRDVWYVGFIPQFTTAVWSGYP